MDFSSLHREEKTLVISNFSMTDPSGCIVQADHISVDLQNSHIDVVSPHVIMQQIPSFSGNGQQHWTFSIHDGRFEGGFASCFFSAEFLSPKQGEIYAYTQDTSVKVNVDFTNEVQQLKIELHSFDLALLQPWIGDFRGMVDGEFSLLRQNGVWIAGPGKIQGKAIAYRNVVDRLRCLLEWEENIACDHFLDAGLWRFSFAEGDFFAGYSSLSKLAGCVTFDGKSGAKWECSGKLEDVDVHSEGRGFFHSLQSSWWESSLSLEGGSVFLGREEKEDGFHYEVKLDQMTARSMSFLQDLAILCKIPCEDWVMEKGTLSAEATCCIDKEGFWKGDVKTFSCVDIAVQKDLFSCSCLQGNFSHGTYFFEGGSFCFADAIWGTQWSGVGDIASQSGSVQGKIGELSLTSKIYGKQDAFHAEIQTQGDLCGTLRVDAFMQESGLHFFVSEGNGTIFSKARVEDVSLQGKIDLEGICCSKICGVLDLGKKVTFSCPEISTKNPFDVRFSKDFLELARFSGEIQESKLELNQEKSHILGKPIVVQTLSSELDDPAWEVRLDLPLTIFSHLASLPVASLEGSIGCVFHYEEGGKSALSLDGCAEVEGSFIPIHFLARQEKDAWRMQDCTCMGYEISGLISFQKEGFSVNFGEVHSEIGKSAFTARFSSWEDWWISLSKMEIHLAKMPFLSQWGNIEGVLEGEGGIHWKGFLEADFDMAASSLKYKEWTLSNRDSLHFTYLAKKGISIQGVNGSIAKEGVPLGDCNIGLVEYNLLTKTLSFAQAELYAFPLLLSDFSLDANASFHCIGDMEFSLDSSLFACFLQEAEIPLEEDIYRVKNCRIAIDPKLRTSQGFVEYRGIWKEVDFSMSRREDTFSWDGKLLLDRSMQIVWELTDTLIIHSIDGFCSGVDASFRFDGEALIGSAHVNCHELKKLVPPDVVKVFDELKMGQGYELKGKIFWEGNGPCFRGILSGKEIELFGFRLKNLLAQFELAKDRVLISDMKISDLAGVLKIDTVIAQGLDRKPWTISIPKITVSELRPSLLQEINGAPKEPNPLIVREMVLLDFQGFAEESKTYTAHGELFFINSYRREKSIFDIPADVLSRIAGLDLDLLIPVCGKVRYTLQDGLVHLTAMEDAFSENRRSEFFLVHNAESPTMDLDWNLNISIQMKQFVLLKFTEAFVIRVTGKLDEPKFQLQNKKRALNL